ncbi:MAG: hypothetical protein HYX74_10975 [Acidobacteria bacterium]|nr:hypothetical protein [Acidobacteriota bacterium]
MSETAAQLFAGLTADGGYVTFASDLPVHAAEVLRSATTLVSLNAQDLSTAPGTIVSPHFAVGSAGGLTYFSTLYLINPGDSLTQAAIEARDPAGRLLGSPKVTLGPREIVRLGIAETFGLGTIGLPILGSLSVRSLAGGALFGSVFLGEAGTGSFASESPLEPVASLGDDLLFEHLATMAGFFTGIAVYNPSSTTPANIRVEVRTPAGDLLGGPFQKVLLPNEKLTSRITELVSASVNRAGGYIRVRSDQPVSAIVLFGDAAGMVLAAVPASKVR